MGIVLVECRPCSRPGAEQDAHH